MALFNYKKKYIKKSDFQFIAAISLCFLLYLLINILNLIGIEKMLYSPLYILKEPYRIFLYNFVHKDINHLFSNICGIVMIRYFLIKLFSKSKYLFFYLIILIIPIQTLFLYLGDVYIYQNKEHFLVGFSGIIFGVFSFLLMSSYWGNNFLFQSFIGLEKDKSIFRLLLFLVSIGLFYSLIPGISLKGHLSGIFSGLIIFFSSKLFEKTYMME